MLAEPRPWRWALLWGALLGVLFFSSYNTVNSFTAQRGDVGVYVFGWERHIPFLAWSIVPYWSIDLLYGLALFTARSKAELFLLGKRLLAAQIICISGFLLWPLRFSFVRPPSEGVFGVLFDALAGFDLPYNQAPSLHIALLLVLWRHYADLLRVPALRVLLHGWFGLIGISVLTTYQHHFIDLIIGAWAGALCLLLVPDGAARWRWRGAEADGKRLRLGLSYLAAALGAAALGGYLFPWATAWLLYWLGASLAMVGAIYLLGEAAHFGKHEGRKPGGGKHAGNKHEGRMPWRSWMVFGPYLLLARLNVWLWTRHLPIGAQVADGIWLGRQPDAFTLQVHRVPTVVDFCAELPLCTRPVHYHGQPLLDLLPPESTELLAAAQAIEAARQHGPVWVCCALGMSRSAAAVMAWLILYRGLNLPDALAQVRRARPQVVLRQVVLLRLAVLHGQVPEVAASS